MAHVLVKDEPYDTNRHEIDPKHPPDDLLNLIHYIEQPPDSDVLGDRLQNHLFKDVPQSFEQPYEQHREYWCSYDACAEYETPTIIKAILFMHMTTFRFDGYECVGLKKSFSNKSTKAENSPGKSTSSTPLITTYITNKINTLRSII